MSQAMQIKQYIINEYFPDSQTNELSDDLDLIENGIMDSMAVLKLVAHLEDHYNIALEPDEIDPENLNSVNAINSLVNLKTN